MFGWVVLENIDVPASGREPTANVADYYWYGYNGLYPEIVAGQPGTVAHPYYWRGPICIPGIYCPLNPPVVLNTCNNGNCHAFGDQYVPFKRTDPLQTVSGLSGKTIGLLGGTFPAQDFTVPMVYVGIDKSVSTFG